MGKFSGLRAAVILGGDRMEGHFVLGHVDGVGIINKIEKKPKEVKIWFEVPKKLSKFVVKKGSIAIDGVSLTIMNIKGKVVELNIIPHTWENTTFSSLQAESKINLEIDMLARYVLNNNAY